MDPKLRVTVAMALLLGASIGVAGISQDQEERQIEPPAPLPEIRDATPGRIELGRMLFFDPRLSGDATISCATCHDPAKGWGDGAALSRGYPGSDYFRNAQTLYNVAYQGSFYWDGRLDGADMPTLVRDHISEAHFLNADGRLVIERMRQVPEYEAGFKEHFGGEPTYGRILEAVCAFVRTIRSRNVPFDRFLAGDGSAISDEARAGYDLFRGKTGCIRCHNGPILADGRYHRMEVPENPAVIREPLRHISFRRFLKTYGVPGYEAAREDPGRYAVTKADEDRGHFRTPSLREVARTAPYMHNGIFSTLDEVIDFYDGRMRLGLTHEEKRQLRTFLETLSGDPFEVEPPQAPEYRTRRLGEN